MREIKFRGWDEGMMVPWDDLKEWECNLSELNELRLMQYTGLKDKNGKEIYEGDVLTTGDVYLYKVVWEDFGFDLIHQYGRWGPLSRFPKLLEDFSKDCEIIGNIYENTELSGF